MVTTMLGIALLGGVVWFLVKVAPKANPQRACTRCHTVAAVSPRCRGNGALEAILWVCLLFPGLIYSAWRGGGKVYQCPACGGDTIPVDTPEGKRIAHNQ